MLPARLGLVLWLFPLGARATPPPLPPAPPIEVLGLLEGVAGPEALRTLQPVPEPAAPEQAAYRAGWTRSATPQPPALGSIHLTNPCPTVAALTLGGVPVGTVPPSGAVQIRHAPVGNYLVAWDCPGLPRQDQESRCVADLSGSRGPEAP